jgi:hypothetical protein
MDVGQESVRVRPGDTYDCNGCGQQLVFDRFGMAPDAALRACMSKCDWLLLGRADPNQLGKSPVVGPSTL